MTKFCGSFDANFVIGWHWQPHLPQEIYQSRLEYFVISTKLSLEQAKQKLEMYNMIRHLVPELFANRDPMDSSIIHLRQSFQWICLPKLTMDKYRVTIFEAIDTDPLAGYSVTTSHKILTNNYEEILHCICVTSKAYGAGIKGIHFINVPYFIDRIVAEVKSALKPKLASRIHIHSLGVESIYEFLPKSVLAADYGGDQNTMSKLSETWGQKLAEWRDWFLAQQNFNVNETLRPKLNQVNANELVGFSRSFRKLDVD